MNAILRRFAAALSLASLALSWPLAFVSAQQAAPTPIAIIGDSHNGPLSGAPNILPPLLGGYSVVGTMCNAGWSVAQLHNGGGGNVSASCFRNQSAVSYLNSLSTKPKAIIVIAGGNGMDTAAELTSFVTDLKTVAPTIVWVGPFYAKDASVQATHTANSQTQKSTLPGIGVNWIEQITVNPSFPYQSDNVHFTIPNGYQQVAQGLAPQILQYLAAAATTNPQNATVTRETNRVEATDSLGRTQDDVNNSLAAQCADTNPVFPVHLGVAIGGTSEVNGLTEYINVVYRYMTAIVLVVTIVMVTYGGFRYLMAATPLGVSDGKDIIKNGIVGMVLVLGAYVILNTLNPATTVLQFTRPPEDIRCRDFEANMLMQNPSYNANFTGLRNTPAISRIQNEWDPLNFRNTYALESSQHLGRHCTETLGNDDCSEGEECVDTLPFLKAINNSETYTGNNEGQVDSSAGTLTQLYQYITRENAAMVCSDGRQLYDPCDFDDECQGDMVCALGWKVCIKRNGNEEGSPCDSALGDSACQSGLKCVNRERNHENLSVAHPQLLRVCTRSVPSITNADIAAFNDGTIDASKRCNYHRECADDGAKCVPNKANTAIRVCIKDETVNGAACGLLNSDQGTGSSYFPCSGSSGYTCAFCPGTGSRVWTNMSGNDRTDKLGQCKPTESIGQNCAGN
ncbi:MAG: pilin [Patescibacteria group bacterium]